MTKKDQTTLNLYCLDSFICIVSYKCSTNSQFVFLKKTNAKRTNKDKQQMSLLLMWETSQRWVISAFARLTSRQENNRLAHLSSIPIPSQKSIMTSL